VYKDDEGKGMLMGGCLQEVQPRNIIKLPKYVPFLVFGQSIFFFP